MYIGVDLGGTNIAVGLVDIEGNILAKSSRPTLADRPFEEIVKDMAQLCVEVTEAAGHTMDEIKGIGIGSPGAVDHAKGEIIYSNNIPWNHVPLRDEMQKYFDHIPVNIENDANAAAYGEYSVNGKGSKTFVAITLGTGVGGGIVIDDKIYRGFNGIGGELGHFTLVHDGIKCTCGKLGCWECYASVTGLIRQTSEAIQKHPESQMAKIAAEEDHISGRTAFNAAKAGDPAAQEVVDAYIRYVADGIVSIINIFQPDLLVIGGGISKEGDYLLDPIKRFVAENTYCKDIAQSKLAIATLFNDAGIIGAALSAKS